VVDNGPGIPDEIIEQIFVPFFTTREKGSGIGLSLSRQIMMLHSGSLKLVSVPENSLQRFWNFKTKQSLFSFHYIHKTQ
jgi:signal transduction histidine kinase